MKNAAACLENPAAGLGKDESAGAKLKKAKVNKWLLISKQSSADVATRSGSGDGSKPR